MTLTTAGPASITLGGAISDSGGLLVQGPGNTTLTQFQHVYRQYPHCRRHADHRPSLGPARHDRRSERRGRRHVEFRQPDRRHPRRADRFAGR